MNSEEQLKITELDRQVANSQLQMLKAALPYVSIEQQRFFAIMSKFLELRNTFRLFQEPNDTVSICETSETPKTPFDMLDIIKSYGTIEERNRIDMMQNMMQAMKFYQQMEQMSSTNSSTHKNEDIASLLNADPETILKTLRQKMSPEDQNRMELFRQMSRMMSSSPSQKA